MMSICLLSPVEQCIPPTVYAFVAVESFSASKLSDNCGIIHHGAAAESRILPDFEHHLDSLPCIKDEECNNVGILLEPKLFLNQVVSIRGGGGSSSSFSLAFAENPSPNLLMHHHSAPLHAAVAASSMQPFPEEHSLQNSTEIVLGNDKKNARQEVETTTISAQDDMTKRHDGMPRRRRFRWRFRFKRRQSLNVNLTDASLPNATRTESQEAVPLRFQRAAKNNVDRGRKRYLKTLKWREQYKMDTILSEPHVHFEFIKQHYPHYFHFTGKKGQPVYFEMPARTNLSALRQGGVTLDILLRHYAMVTEFTWQYVSRDDLQQSIYVIDLQGIRPRDFVGECVTFVRKACAFCNQHYPERSGCILVINVPSYFALIWRVVKKFADRKTLDKVKILRGKDEILDGLLEFIDIDNIPPEYGGNSMPLGEAPEEKPLWDVMRHNNHVALHGTEDCGGTKGGCPYCSFELARNY